MDLINCFLEKESSPKQVSDNYIFFFFLIVFSVYIYLCVCVYFLLFQIKNKILHANKINFIVSNFQYHKINSSISCFNNMSSHVTSHSSVFSFSTSSCTFCSLLFHEMRFNITKWNWFTTPTEKEIYDLVTIKKFNFHTNL